MQSTVGMRAIGLMSGTSLDGVDVALLDTDGERTIVQGPTGFVPYHDEDRALLRTALADARDLADRTARPGALADAERSVTERHAEAVEAFLVRHRIERGSVGIPVMADMRGADVADGGQGAPLVPVFHRALVRSAGLPGATLVINIGGVANVTLVNGDDDPVACDTGPGNALIDDLMLERTGSAVDHNGATAAAGRVDDDALARLLEHPFFVLPPPKSLDRNDFSRLAVAGLSTPDAAATLTAFTAESIARCLVHFSARPAHAVVCGGGAHNPTLMAALAARMSCPVTTGLACGWQGDAIEAQAFAYLAVRALDHRPLTFPTTTGVTRPLSGGILYAP